MKITSTSPKRQTVNSPEPTPAIAQPLRRATVGDVLTNRDGDPHSDLFYEFPGDPAEPDLWSHALGLNYEAFKHPLSDEIEAVGVALLLFAKAARYRANRRLVAQTISKTLGVCGYHARNLIDAGKALSSFTRAITREIARAATRNGKHK